VLRPAGFIFLIVCWSFCLISHLAVEVDLIEALNIYIHVKDILYRDFKVQYGDVVWIDAQYSKVIWIFLVDIAPNACSVLALGVCWNQNNCGCCYNCLSPGSCSES